MQTLFVRVQLILFALLLCLTDAARAELTIEITQGAQGALPIAIVPFAGNDASGGAAQDDIAAIVSADLQRSGRFKPLPAQDMLEKPSEASQVNFQNWRVLGMDNLVIGKLQGDNAGGYNVDFQLFDVFQGNSLLGYTVHGSGKELRRIAHHIADLIYEKLTGE